MNPLFHSIHLANGPLQCHSSLPPFWGSHTVNPVFIILLLSFFIFFQPISTCSLKVQFLPFCFIYKYHLYIIFQIHPYCCMFLCLIFYVWLTTSQAIPLLSHWLAFGLFPAFHCFNHEHFCIYLLVNMFGISFRFIPRNEIAGLQGMRMFNFRS